MTQQLLRLDLVRAWENYFRQKGGESPRATQDILTVLQVDDAAAYPPYRRWAGGISAGAVAAQYSYVCWGGTDTTEKRSVVVVDEIFFRQPNNDDIVVGLELASNLPVSTIVSDIAEEKDQGATARPRIGNVALNALSTASNFAGETFPFNAGGRIPGPWSIPTGGVLFIRPATVNELIVGYARGRYYPTL